MKFVECLFNACVRATIQKMKKKLLRNVSSRRVNVVLAVGIEEATPTSSTTTMMTELEKWFYLFSLPDNSA